jgi:translation initiation factor 6 (eIF-6)
MSMRIMSQKFIGFYISDVCKLYSVLPSELDDDVLAIIQEDLNQMCLTIYGKRAFIYPAPEAVK